MGPRLSQPCCPAQLLLAKCFLGETTDPLRPSPRLTCFLHRSNLEPRGEVTRSGSQGEKVAEQGLEPRRARP